MDPWCRLSNEEHIDEGEFYQSVLESNRGLPLHLESDFLDYLAELVMQRYEGQPGEKTVTLSPPGQVNPRRTKWHYRRLFDDKQKVTQDFITWASETLGLWIELSMEQTLYAEGGIPHASDPAFDVLSIAEDAQRVPRLRIVQVKATNDNLQGQANEAINKFERLENGEFDAELSAKLELIERRRDGPAGVNVADLFFDADRYYRVTVVHDEDHTSFRILTTYRDKVPGQSERRSAYLVRAQWPDFWDELGRRVFGQLT